MPGAFGSAFSSAFDVGAAAAAGPAWWFAAGYCVREDGVFKNVASQKLTLLVIDTAANVPRTGDAANLTAYVSKDDGAVTALGDTSAAELDATNAPGLYSFDLTQAETNADKLLFSGKSSTAGVRVVPLLAYTRANNVNDLVIDASGNLTAGITGNLTGNVSGSVGSVTGNVGGSVGSVASNGITAASLATGAITAAKFAAGAIDAAAVADGAIDRAAFAADTGLQTARSGTAQAGASTSITLDASASSTTDFFKHCRVRLTGGTGAGQHRLITAYNGTTKVATVTPAWATSPDNTSTFAVVADALGDVGAFRGTASAGAAGYAGLDWGNVTAPTTSVNLSGTTISTSQAVASVSGAVGSVTATVNANVTQISGDTAAADNAESFFDGTGYAGTNNVIPTVTAVTNAVTVTGTPAVNVTQISGDATAADSLEAALDGTGGVTITAALTGNVTGNLSGSVGSVTGNVGGNVVGSVGSVASGGISAASLATDAITAAKIAADAGAEIGTAVWASATRTLTSLAGLTVDTVANLTNDPTGVTTLLSRLTSTRAGYLDNLSAGAVATAAALDAVDNFVDTEVAAIKAVTDKLDTAVELDGSVYRFTTNALENAPAGGGGGSADWTAGEKEQIRSALGVDGTKTAATGGQLQTLSGYVDTEVAAIKAKTDSLTFSTAGRVDAQVFGMEAGTVTAGAVATGAIDADALAADAGTEIGTAVWASGTRTLTSLSGLTVDTVTTLTNLPSVPNNWLTAAGIAGDAITAAKIAADAGSEIGTAVWASGARTLTSLSGLTVDTVTTLTNLPAVPNNWLTAAGIAADAITAGKVAADVGAELAAALLDLANAVETGVTVRQALRLMASALGGVLDGAATATVTSKAAANSGTTRITATVDADGNRSSVTLNL